MLFAGVETIVGNLGEPLRDSLMEDHCDLDALEVAGDANTVDEGLLESGVDEC